MPDGNSSAMSQTEQDLDEFELEEQASVTDRKGNAHVAKRVQSLQNQLERLRKDHRVKVQELIAKNKKEKADWERMLRDQTRAIHENYEREFSRQSKNYQFQIDQMRQIYTGQITQILEILKNAIDSQVMNSKEQPATSNSANQAQVDDLKRWMVEEFTNRVMKYKEIMASVKADEVNNTLRSKSGTFAIDTSPEAEKRVLNLFDIDNAERQRNTLRGLEVSVSQEKNENKRQSPSVAAKGSRMASGQTSFKPEEKRDRGWANLLKSLGAN